MAVIKNSKDILVDDLKTAFTKSDNDVSMCENISKAIVTFAQKAEINVNVTGTVDTGVYTGTGKGHLVLNFSKMSTELADACNNMYIHRESGDYGNDYYASALCTSFRTMLTQKNVIHITTTGSTTPPPPASGTVAPYKIEVTGTLSGSIVSATENLEQTFSNMLQDAGSGGLATDQYFATRLANVVYSWLINAGVSVQDSTKEVQGTGTVTFLDIEQS